MTILDDMHAVMRDFTPLPKRELRCGRAAWDVLRSGIKTDNLGTADPLWGIPIHIDPELTDGAWKFLEDGEVIHEGDMTPGHRRAIYIGNVGLFGVTDEVADMVYRNLDERLARRADEHTEGCR